MTVLLFPGQGSQQAGAAAVFRESCSEAQSLFTIAAEILPADVFDIILNGAQESLNDTRYAQPALLCTETAAAALLNFLGVSPALCAGHSLGEITALVACGALSFKDALVLVQERARLMSTDVPEGGMAAVLGLSADRVEEVLPEEAQVANYNGPAQTIISGTRRGLETAEACLKEAGAKRVIPLAVSGPFHSRYMETAGNALARFLENIPVAAPTIPFLSSVSGTCEVDPCRIRALLAEQLYRPVQWTRVMEYISGRKAVEAGPGAVLQGLAKRMPGGPMVHAGSTPELCRAFAALQES